MEDNWELKYHWELINEQTHNIVECQREYRYIIYR